MSPLRVSVWPPLPPGAQLARRRSPLPFPLEEPECRLYARARQGVYHGIRALGLGPGDEVLAPALHHGSEIEALLQAGVRCRFYDVGLDLGPDPAELERLVGRATRALYLIHTLGIPQDPELWRAWCDERGLLLVEDAAQAWLGTWKGRPLGSLADLAVFCLYKSFGVPDGGAAVARAPLPRPRAARPVALGKTVRRHGAWLAQRVGRAGPAGSRWGNRTSFDHLADIALGDVDAPASAATVRLIPRVADPAAAAARRAHYAALRDQLGELVPPELGGLPEGAAPFALPIAAGDPDQTWSRLARRGIDALTFWTHSHPDLEAGRFPQAGHLRRLVGLPVHQELRTSDVEGIAAAVLEER